ncbi:hypothetical protein COO60DRAFT_1632571, partial [Scenedesmus sp. NREL 46B-D3]
MLHLPRCSSATAVAVARGCVLGRDTSSASCFRLSQWVQQCSRYVYVCFRARAHVQGCHIIREGLCSAPAEQPLFAYCELHQCAGHLGLPHCPASHFWPICAPGAGAAARCSLRRGSIVQYAPAEQPLFAYCELHQCAGHLGLPHCPASHFWPICAPGAGAAARCSLRRGSIVQYAPAEQPLFAYCELHQCAGHLGLPHCPASHFWPICAPGAGAAARCSLRRGSIVQYAPAEQPLFAYCELHQCAGHLGLPHCPASHFWPICAPGAGAAARCSLRRGSIVQYAPAEQPLFAYCELHQCAGHLGLPHCPASHFWPICAPGAGAAARCSLRRGSIVQYAPQQQLQLHGAACSAVTPAQPAASVCRNGFNNAHATFMYASEHAHTCRGATSSARVCVQVQQQQTMAQGKHADLYFDDI